MGPILIFDKSTLQSLSLDESVWLENFFLNNITPLLYVETLGDLALGTHHSGRPAEVIISELAAKTPIQHAHPNIHHQRLVLGSLLGQKVEMSGRPIIDGGVTKMTPDGKLGVHFDESPETKAMNRWYKGEFLDIEKEFSKEWRHSLSDLNFDSILGLMNNLVPRALKLSNLNSIKSFVDRFTAGNNKEVLLLALDILKIPDKARLEIIQRWNRIVYPSFDVFAPYASFVLKVDLVFYISMLRGFISKERPSNKIDLSYLYYSPFCHVFVSNDKLHARLAPLFLRQDQSFVVGSELKLGFKAIDNFYQSLPQDIKDLGTIKFAIYPPKEIHNVIHDLWDKHCPKWRGHSAKPIARSQPISKDKGLSEHIKNVDKSKVVDPTTLKNLDDADHVIFKQRVRVQKGKWRILPKGIEDKEKV